MVHTGSFAIAKSLFVPVIPKPEIEPDLFLLFSGLLGESDIYMHPGEQCCRVQSALQ
jgi:hypothetical protein